jgi:hypothetical protein
MNKHHVRVTAILLFIILFVFWISVTSATSSTNSTHYPLSPIDPTLYLQGNGNWCGPGVLQSAIQWVNQYNDGAPVSPAPTMITKTEIWGFMRDTSCSALGGRDSPLPGTVGDGLYDVRELNIAYDVGVDPHALAWVMWTHNPGYYHYWRYDNQTQATRYLLYTLEKYHEPVLVAVRAGFHWVLVINYDADGLAYPINPGAGNINAIQIADPEDASKIWFQWSTGDRPWTTYWFTQYTDITHDPDPSTGWYVPPPAHWQGHYVTIERDEHTENPDYGWSLSGAIPTTHPSTHPIYVPLVWVN